MKRTVFLVVALLALMVAVLPAQTRDPGEDWKKVDNNPFGTTAVNDIVFANNTFIAVGAGGKIAYSDSGKTFVAVTNSQFGTSNIRAVANGGGRFVAVGDAGKAAYSTDNGRTWTAVASTGFGTSNILGIAYGGNRFVAVGQAGKIAYSTNGQTWTMVPAASQPSKGDIVAIAFGSNRFIIPDNYDYNGKLYQSGNGEAWTAIADSKFPADGNSEITSVNFVNNMFFAGGSATTPDGRNTSSNLPYSKDGLTWTGLPDTSYLRTMVASPKILDIAFGAGKYYIVGSMGLFYSTDNVTWTYINVYDNIGRYSGVRCIVFGANKFVVAGTSGMLSYLE